MIKLTVGPVINGASAQIFREVGRRVEETWNILVLSEHVICMSIGPAEAHGLGWGNS